MSEAAGLMRAKRGLIMGVANNRSIAWGIAKACRAQGANLAFTYQGERLKENVEELAQPLPGSLILPMDVTKDEDIQALGDTMKREVGTVDFLVHAVAFAKREELDGHFVDINRRFSEILGYSEAELHNMTFSELTHPDDRAVNEAFVRQLLAGEIPEYTLEKRYLCKGGGEIWSLTTVTLMRDAAGQPDRFMGVIEDITQRKNAETALHEDRRILEILNETGKLLASQLDLQSLVQAVTDAATQLSGAQFG